MKQGYSAKEVQSWLIVHLAEQLRVCPESIDPFEPFYGHIIGGFQSNGIAQDMEKWLGIKLSSSIFYEHPDIATLSHHIVKEKLRSEVMNNLTHRSQIYNQIPKLINKGIRIFWH